MRAILRLRGHDPGVPVLLFLGMHVARRLRNRSIGYMAIGLAAFASWAGLPGPGEAGLIAGAAYAARHRLDIVDLELVACSGAFVGGIVGFVLGVKFGARLAERPGPLLGARRRSLKAGERFYERFGPVAVLLTPSWVAGIHRVKTVPFIVFNLIAAVAWTALYGLTTYFAGPKVAEYFGDVGKWATAAIVVAAVGLAALAVVRRRRKRAAER
jgi:membrane protein DedA with SNARE-associated domain